MKYAKRICLILNIVCVLGIAGFLLLSKNFLLEGGDRRVIGVCYSNFSDEYQRVLNDSIYPMVSENKDILHYKDAAGSQSRQNLQIMNLVEEGCELIIVVPVDSKVESGIRYAKEKGVYVVVVDRMLREEDTADMKVLSDNYSSGRDLAKYLTANKAASNILLICKEGDESANESALGFENTIKAWDSEDFKIAGKVYTDGTKADLRKKLRVYKDRGIDTVFCVSDVIAKWSSKELEDVYFLSVGGSPEGKRMVADRKLFATVNQFPSTMGDEAIRGAYNILNGRDEEKTLIVSSKIITINTVDSHEIEKWE